jgi:hypothetical protein
VGYLWIIGKIWQRHDDIEYSALRCAFMGEIWYYVHSVMTGPAASVYLVGTLGRAATGAFFELVLGVILGTQKN